MSGQSNTGRGCRPTADTTWRGSSQHQKTSLTCDTLRCLSGLGAGGGAEERTESAFMSLVRDELAHFIQSEGHRVDVALLDEDGRCAELLFRTRGYVFSVTVVEGEAPGLEIATAYEIPPWARERAQNATTLRDVASDVDGVRFALAANGKTFVVRLCCAQTLAEFERDFWSSIARVREAGVAALERILDRSESRAAANKFITSLTRGD
jgi:hypothetical protein